MKGLVVDLRANPGGNLATVTQMLDLLLPKVRSCQQKTRVVTKR